MVNVLATVRDKHGMIVSNLGKDDFVLTEDGKPQTIAYFSQRDGRAIDHGTPRGYQRESDARAR